MRFSLAWLAPLGIGTALASASVRLCCLLWPLILSFEVGAQPLDETQRKQLEYTRAHYTKYDFRIPMRDGVRLFTSVYVPKDQSQRYPILLQRTPYSVAPYGIDNYRPVLGPSEACEKEGFIFACQDVRGRFLSEGTFIDVPPHKPYLAGPKDTDESTDTYDTIDWLVKNVPNCNAKVGIWGISYPGFYAAFSLIGAHPALEAVSPQAPMGDVGNGDDTYHNGAFFLAANFGFFSGFKPRPGGPDRPRRRLPFDYGTADAYRFFLELGPLSNSNARYLKHENPYWDELLAHPNYDEFWRTRALAQYMKEVKPAVLFVGGWFDAEDLAGPLKLFYALQENQPSAQATLVMGPWPHGGWSRGAGDRLGNLGFGSKTGEFFREQIELPFFNYHLKGKGIGLKPAPGLPTPRAWLFATGKNEWHTFANWPPKSATPASLYLNAGGGLVWRPAAGDGHQYDEYVSDPAKPVAVVGYIGPGMPSDYMTADQRFAAQRPDVLAYETTPLEADVTVVGAIKVRLRVSSSGTDADFDVKLIDVYPNDYPDPEPNPERVRLGGYQQLVRGEPFRAKFRTSREWPEPLTPGEPTRLEFAMPDVCHTFRIGHRIMVQIQSSWFPLTDRNPQKFVDIPSAQAADFKKAVQRVYRGGPEGSALLFQTLEP